MDLSPTTTTVTQQRDKLWLGSQHGTDCTESITLDIAGGTFAAVRVADGRGGFVIPTGTPVVKGADGLYDLAADDLVAADGHVFEDVLISADSVHAGAALFWHGKVVQAELPAGSGFVDANRAPFIRYV
jgi:hypothetical protein